MGNKFSLFCCLGCGRGIETYKNAEVTCKCGKKMKIYDWIRLSEKNRKKVASIKAKLQK
jgi:hypothetical protein